MSTQQFAAGRRRDVVGCAGRVSERVRLLGTANTLVRDHPEHPGLVCAENTDVDGILGALAAAGVLPFNVESFRAVIRAGGKGANQACAAGSFASAARFQPTETTSRRSPSLISTTRPDLRSRCSCC